MSNFTMPDYKAHFYRFNNDSKWFDLIKSPAGGPVIRGDIKIEETRDEKIRAPKVIHDRQRQYQWRFFTGMRPTGINDWYFGDAFKEGKKSFILFHITKDSKELKLFWFNSFYPKPNLKKFLLTAIPYLSKEKFND